MPQTIEGHTHLTSPCPDTPAIAHVAYAVSPVDVGRVKSQHLGPISHLADFGLGVRL